MTLHALVDKEIPCSIISAAKREELGYRAEDCAPFSIRDSAGREYIADCHVVLRWRKRGGGRTYDEDFYVVSDISRDVIFAASAVPDVAQANAYPLAHPPLSEGT